MFHTTRCPLNWGKSRVFYEKDGYKYSGGRDFPYCAQDEESWVELKYLLTSEEFTSLADIYKSDENKLVLRKYFKTHEKMHDGKTATGYIFGYKTDGQLSDEPFYGAKNVGTGKIGDIVHIPAVSKVDEHTKLSGPSPLRDLITSVLEDVVEASGSYEQFDIDLDRFAGEIKDESTTDGRSLTGFEEEFNELIQSWSTQFKLKFSTPSAAGIIKSMLDFDFFDQAHGMPQTADQFGSGFQRHVVYSLVRIGSKYVRKKIAKKSKDFSPSMNLILFEEPEAFLHPSQQDILATSLMEIAQSDTRQVLCSTHSPQFVSRNTAHIPSLIRLARKQNGEVESFQIQEEKWIKIVDANQEINRIAQRFPKMAKDLASDDLKPEMEVIKYCLWLNPDRCGMFFANHVLLVEGISERVLVTRLLDEQKLKTGQGIYVLDCLGKYNVHRFMNLLAALGVSHSVIYDGDASFEHHSELNDLITTSYTDGVTYRIEALPTKTEEYLGVPPPSSKHRKPQHLLHQYESGKIEDEKLRSFCKLVESCLP